jgi:hypothetical protein
MLAKSKGLGEILLVATKIVNLYFNVREYENGNIRYT